MVKLVAAKPAAVTKVTKPKLVSSPASSPALTSTLSFFLEDFNRTLFPLKTNRELIQRGEAEIKSYISKCLNPSDLTHRFLAQKRVYAAKPTFHLRRTVKLDVVSEYYLYDIVFRNRALFRKPHTPGRTHYGYRFEHGVAITPTAAYKAFKGALAEYGKTYPHFISFDVASYFNGVYHHDLVSWFAERGASPDDSSGLGQLSREINSGRSVDCLPQGLYPTKMIGNDFLRFIDNYFGVQSDKLVRFMDDFHLFSSNQKTITEDFQTIQKLLGDKGLSVNPSKTSREALGHAKLDADIDAAKAALLKRRRLVLTTGYEDDEVVQEIMVKSPLTEKELAYISSILDKPEIDEEDAELVLTVMRDHTSKVEKRLPYLISAYPHLTKNVYSFCAGVPDKDFIVSILIDAVKGSSRLIEFQLFWFGAILEDYLMKTPRAAELIDLLFNHPSATSITKAKILEVKDTRFGLDELRHEFLVSGQSDWLAWSSAVGSLALQPISRNHKLSYFGNFSEMNHLIASIILK